MKHASLYAMAGAALAWASLLSMKAEVSELPGTGSSRAAVHPRDFVIVREGASYVVPPGKVFVATAVGDAAFHAAHSLVIDGKIKASSLYSNGSGAIFSGTYSIPAAISVIPPGLLAPEGSTVECTIAPFWAGAAGMGTGRVWGYLLDEPQGNTKSIVNPRHPTDKERVVIEEGTPFVVPPEKLFVLTALGSTASFPNHSLQIDGVIEATGGTQKWHSSTVVEFPPGLAAPGGSTVEVIDVPNDPRDFGDGIAFGYLVDA